MNSILETGNGKDALAVGADLVHGLYLLSVKGKIGNFSTKALKR